MGRRDGDGEIGARAETYRAWERGTNEPGLRDIVRICLATGCTAEYLILGIDELDAANEAKGSGPDVDLLRSGS